MALSWNHWAMVLGVLLNGMGGATQEDTIFKPETAIVEEASPNAEITNGHAFESGGITVDGEQILVFPENAVVEEYDGERVLFYLTKSLSCGGHPPSPMHIKDGRKYLGVAWSVEDGEMIFSTFGEWANRGGTRDHVDFKGSSSKREWLSHCHR